jgi:predicted transposase YbfD/YdcC
VKRNQPTLFDTLSTWAETAPAGTTHTACDIGRRNRNESRCATVWPLPASVAAQLPEWPRIACLVRIERNTDLFNTTDHTWKNREETAWHICTRMLTAEQANACVRQHWSIENSFHYVRDVAMGEDASRIRKQPGTFARLRSWALNILHIKGFHKIHAARQTLGWDPNAAWNCLNVS